MCKTKGYFGIGMACDDVNKIKKVWKIRVRDGSEMNGKKLEVLTSKNQLALGMIVNFNIGKVMVHGKECLKAIEVTANTF